MATLDVLGALLLAGSDTVGEVAIADVDREDPLLTGSLEDLGGSSVLEASDELGGAEGGADSDELGAMLDS